MPSDLSANAFVSLGREVLAPHGLDTVLECVLDSLSDHVVGLRYFHNPHFVFSLNLGTKPLQTDVSESLTSLWLAKRPDFAALGTPSSDLEVAEDEGGVHEGRAGHVELYLDQALGKSRYALHNGGRSFRIRASRSMSEHGTDVRVLVILSDSPFGVIEDSEHLVDLWGRPPASLGSAWRGLAEPAWLALHGAVPSLVNCFLFIARDWDLCMETLHKLAAVLPKPELHVVMKNHKQTTRTTLRAWKQDGTTGVMNPAWAYAVLDQLRLDVEPSLTARLGARAFGWSEFHQVEIEVGPSAAHLHAAAELMMATRARLTSLGASAIPVYGRKYHRLLTDARIAS
jgi:hypothetical protein